MTNPKGQQLMFGVRMFANTIIVDSMQVGVDGKLQMFNEMVRKIGELVDLDPPADMSSDEICVLKRTIVFQELLDAINRRASSGQDALEIGEQSFVELAKGCPELQEMITDYLAYYATPNKLFEQVENAVEVEQVKRLSGLVF